MLKEFFEQNNFHMISEYKKADRFFGNYGYTFEKDGIYFIYTYEKRQHYLELKKNNGVSNSVIGLGTILGVENEVLDEEKILELLKKIMI